VSDDFYANCVMDIFHKSTLLATLDEIELAALIPGKANIRELFPFYGVVMAFLCLSLFLTFCFETFYDETSDNSPGESLPAVDPFSLFSRHRHILT
jgi:hypothetical protein